MSERAKNEDFVRIRAVLRREVEAGRSFDEAVEHAANEQPVAFERIMKPLVA
jgi:hypothetical protein